MSELPSGWTRAPIGSLCSLINGRAFKPTEWKAEGIPIVRIQNLNNRAALFNFYQGELDVRHRLHGGELLFAWSGTPGTSFGAHIWHGQQGALNQHIFRVDFDDRLFDKRFFRFAINEKLTELIGVAQGGVGLRHVTKGVFESTEVAVPPRAEQTRIADQLDTLLARIQACNNRLNAIPALLKRFRRAVLDAATSGALTADWRDHADTTAWEPTTVSKVLDGKPRNGYSPKAVKFETPVRSLTLSATTSGRFLPHHTKFIDEQIPTGSHLWLEPGDILIQRANTLEYVGVSAIFDGPRKTFIYPDLMMKCRPNARVHGRYLYYLLSAEKTRKYFRENATGTAGNMPKINQQTVMSAPIDLPPKEEQTEIVRRVRFLLDLADRIEIHRSVAMDRARRLIPLTLAKAFRGELVQQDANDEPASILLQRIANTPAKPAVTTLRGQPRNKRPNPSTRLPTVQQDPAALPAGAWIASGQPDEHATTAQLIAVLRAWGQPMPQDQARMATVLCLQPRLFTALLPANDATSWHRLVGAEAQPLPASVAALQPEVNIHWRRALAGLRARGDLVVSGSGPQDTWALGPGADRVDTAGWPDGRAGWVAAYLRAHGVEALLPLLSSAAVDFVHARAA